MAGHGDKRLVVAGVVLGLFYAVISLLFGKPLQGALLSGAIAGPLFALLLWLLESDRHRRKGHGATMGTDVDTER